MKREIGDYLQDVIDAMNKGMEFVEDMRDKLIHGYFGVNSVRIWETVKEEIPPLKPLFEKLLNDLEK